MQDVVDVFLFPSLYSGLGSAVVEAQAAGLPCVLSDAVPGSIHVVPGQVTALKITEPDEAWAVAVLNAARTGHHAFNRRQFARFDIEHTIKIWERVYSTGSAF